MCESVPICVCVCLTAAERPQPPQRRSEPTYNFGICLARFANLETPTENLWHPSPASPPTGSVFGVLATSWVRPDVAIVASQSSAVSHCDRCSLFELASELPYRTLLLPHQILGEADLLLNNPINVGLDVGRAPNEGFNEPPANGQSTLADLIFCSDRESKRKSDFEPGRPYCLPLVVLKTCSI